MSVENEFPEVEETDEFKIELEKMVELEMMEDADAFYNAEK